MTYVPHAVTSAVYDLADRALTRALLTRIPTETAALLADDRRRLPPLLVDEVIASRVPELRTALAASASRRAGDVFDRLAALGDPALAEGLHGMREAYVGRVPEQRRAVWAGAAATADDPGWRAPDGLVAKLLESKDADLLQSALDSPFPDLVAHAEAVCKEPETPPEPVTPARRAVPSAEQRPETTAELIDVLRVRRRRYSSTYLVNGPEKLDWEALLEAHRAEPFDHAALRALWEAGEDCPQELAVASFAAYPPTRHGDTRKGGGPLYWPMLTALDFSRHEHALRAVLPEGIASGVFPVDRVLAEIKPARHVLNELPHSDERVRAALAAQVARLGSDFANWRALHHLLPRFTGTVPALIDAALAAAPRHAGKTWPNPMGPEFPPRRNSLGRTAWLHLFDRADQAVQLDLSERMDARTIQYLLMWHLPDQSVRDHIVATHGAAVLAGLASHWATSAEVIEDLITYDDPEVNAALFLHTNLTDAQRRHVLAGLRWKQGAATPAAERLPLTPALLQGLRESARRNWLLPATESGDPDVCRILLGNQRVKVHTDPQHLLMLVRLWERHGPDEVRALLDETDFPPRKKGKHPVPPQVREAAQAALDASDGLEVLRAAQAAAAGPAGLVDHLRINGPQRDLAKYLDLWAEENGSAELPWAGLLAAHRAEPLDDRLLVDLHRLEGCPADLVEATATARLRLSHRNYTPRKGKRPPTLPEMLRTLPLPEYAGRDNWPAEALHSGQVTAADILRDAFPALACVTYLGDETPAQDTRPWAHAVAELVEAMGALVREHLGDDPEGWTMALRLMPDFGGTLPDLLATAKAVVS
ncbi:hypothetical protein SRB5_43510 [Streptomyces sp. RB5]|uniref:Uncharacterized protein n=1 Tax=Streptomyces smaragdinus TaxID=2585196 RepID=A0A7K0CL26_9ACTN|nr:hypothetical protein [Streptomyces smaragdinus]MQY14189.1 hypothetical protein [Streptomyces smaragdinus]